MYCIDFIVGIFTRLSNEMFISVAVTTDMAMKILIAALQSDYILLMQCLVLLYANTMSQMGLIECVRRVCVYVYVYVSLQTHIRFPHLYHLNHFLSRINCPHALPAFACFCMRARHTMFAFASHNL